MVDDRIRIALLIGVAVAVVISICASYTLAQSVFLVHPPVLEPAELERGQDVTEGTTIRTGFNGLVVLAYDWPSDEAYIPCVRYVFIGQQSRYVVSDARGAPGECNTQESVASLDDPYTGGVQFVTAYGQAKLDGPMSEKAMSSIRQVDDLFSTLQARRSDPPKQRDPSVFDYPRDASGTSKGLDRFIVAESHYYREFVLLINDERSPLHDNRIRSAIDYSIPYPSMQDVVGHVLDSPVVHFGYDPERGRMLLAEAGFPDGFRATLLVPDHLTFYASWAGILVNAFDDAGITVRVEIAPQSTVMGRVQAGEYELAIVQAVILQRAFGSAGFD